MPHFCSGSRNVSVDWAMHGKHSILHYESSILSLPKNGKITAARSICAYHIGNKAQWLCPLPRGTFHIPESGGPSPFQAQKPECPLSMCTSSGTDFAATRPPKLMASLFTQHEKYFPGAGTHILHNQSFLPQLPAYRKSQGIQWSECHFVHF